MKVSKTSVHNAVMKNQNEGIFKDRKWSDRPRISSSRKAVLCVRWLFTIPWVPPKKIQAKLMEIGTVDSAQTIQHRFSLEFGLKSCKPARKPRLTQAMKKYRLDFAKRHANWDTEMWKKKHFLHTSLLHSSFLFEDIGVGGLLEHATRISRISQRQNTPLAKWYLEGNPSEAQLDFLFFASGTYHNGKEYVDLLTGKLELHVRVHNCHIFMHGGVLRVIKAR